MIALIGYLHDHLLKGSYVQFGLDVIVVHILPLGFSALKGSVHGRPVPYGWKDPQKESLGMGGYQYRFH